MVTNHLGQAALGDVKAAAPYIFQSPAGQDLRLTLGYDVRVDKGGFEWAFMVDAGTGKIIQSAQVQFGPDPWNALD